MQRNFGGWLLLIFSFVTFVGCGGSGGGGSSGSPDGVKRRELSSLPGVEDELPPNDGGRVAIFSLKADKNPNKSWHVAPRSQNYLVRFHQKDGKVPQIIVTAENSKFDGVDTVTAENLVDFADKVADSLSGGEKKVALIEPPRPMILGSNPWVRYVRGGRIASELLNIDRQVLVTVVAGRTYQIELQTAAGKLTESRDAAYAVAANMKFKATSGPAAPAADAPASETPEPKKEEPASSNADK